MTFLEDVKLLKHGPIKDLGQNTIVPSLLTDGTM
jgi:hypothetical protein